MAKQMKDVIRKARQEQGLTQQALAEKAGVAISTISQIERGWPPSVQTVQAVADVLGLKLRLTP